MKSSATFLDWWIRLESALHRSLGGKGVPEDLVEDVIQEIAVLAVAQARQLGSYESFLAQFASYERFFSWARLRANWLILDRLRANRKLLGDLDSLDLARGPDQENETYWAELRRLITDLPGRQRTAIAGMLEGRTATELADKMQITEATVRSLQRFARSQLANKILSRVSNELKESDHVSRVG